MNLEYQRFDDINNRRTLRERAVSLETFKRQYTILYKASRRNLFIMLKTFIIFMSLIFLSHGCLITNCPRGGKRSDFVPALKTNIRECSSCGPNRLGQCFGPHICCGPSIGCFIGTPETYRCRKESLYSRPCIAGYAMCRGNTARCAANGICCSQESCYMDTSCKIIDLTGNDRKTDADLSALLSGNEISSEMLQ